MNIVETNVPLRRMLLAKVICCRRYKVGANQCKPSVGLDGFNNVAKYKFI